MTENNFGKTFQELRKLSKTPFADFKPVIGRDSLVKFEAGKTMLSYDRLVGCLEIMGITESDFSYLTGKRKVDKRYGSMFYLVRYQRGYRSDFFESLGISQLQVKLFEAERIMLPYSSVDAMLLMMHVPESDYGFSLNSGQDDYFIQIVDNLDKAFLTDDIHYIKQIEKEAGEFSAKIEPKAFIPDDDETHDYAEDRLTRQFADYRVLELTAKSLYTSLSQEELEEISDFLMGLDLWLEYSLGILGLVARSLSYSLLHDTLSELRKESWRYKEKLVYRRRIVQAGSRAAMALLKQGKVLKAGELLDLVEPFCFSLDTHIQGMNRFTRACLKWKKSHRIEDKENARNDMEKAIDYFDFIGEKSSAKRTQRFYDEIINKS